MAGINYFKKNYIQSFGDSMKPLLLNNDIVYFKSAKLNNIDVDDIIVVRKKSYFFTHRVIYKTTIFCVTKGDNVSRADGKVFTRQIVGKLTRVKRGKKIIIPDHFYFIYSGVYWKEIVTVNKMLEKAGIDFVVLKGLPLHLFYYKTYPRRLYADCDILVMPSQFIEAVGLFRRNGWRVTKPTGTSRSWKTAPEVSLTKTVRGVSVTFDIHREPVFMMTQFAHLESLYPRTLMEAMTAEFLRDKRFITISGVRLPILAPHHLVVYLALHIFHHNFRGAFRYALFNRVIRQESKRSTIEKKQWAHVAQFIRAYCLENFMHCVFGICVQLFKTGVPRFVKIGKANGYRRLWAMYRARTDRVFHDQTPVQAGVERFASLFIFSPHPLWRKLGVFLNPQVVMMAMRLIRNSILFVFPILLKKLFFSRQQQVDERV